MKKTLHIALAAAAAALTAAGCAKVGEPDAPEGQEITITASFAEDQTKTTLQDGGTAVYWEAGDKIKVFYGSEGSCFTSTATEITAASDFSGSLNFVFGSDEGVGGSKFLWALYPYNTDAVSDGVSVTTTFPSKQTGKAGSFANGMNISLAKSNSFNMGFYNVCGGVRFSITKEGVKKVIFEALNGEAIAGKARLVFDGSIPVVQEVVEKDSTITLTIPDNGTFETGKWYYIVALPGTLAGGFKMTFNTDSQYAELKSTASVSLKRSVFGSLADADAGLVFKDNTVVSPEGTVDMGLSVYWATCNVGASSPEDFGGHYAFGETANKSKYAWTNYKWCKVNYHNLTKYCHSSQTDYWYDYSAGVNEPDNILELEKTDDVANVKLGAKFRIPTNAEWKELMDSCIWTWSQFKGVNGMNVESLVTGNSIFLPAAGSRVMQYANNYGKYGYYLSSSLSSYCYKEFDLTFGSNLLELRPGDRYVGLSVRPVSEL